MAAILRRAASRSGLRRAFRTMARRRSRRIAPLVALMASGACGSLLEPDPETFVPPDAYYESESQIELAVSGVYASVQTLHRQLQWAFAEFQSDNTSFQINAA